jgi:hypothetical protein
VTSSAVSAPLRIVSTPIGQTVVTNVKATTVQVKP